MNRIDDTGMNEDGHTNKADRLTITLSAGQREALQIIADRNRVSLAFVVRRALEHFIEEHGGWQLRFQYPDNS
jgi:hypothetical protein